MKKTGCLWLCVLLLFCTGCSFSPIGTESSSVSKTETRQTVEKSSQTAPTVETVPESTDGMPNVIDGAEVGVASGKQTGSDKKREPEKRDSSGVRSDADTETVSNPCYIGNRNSKVFHKPDCAALKKMKEANMRSFSTRAEAIEAGFRSCAQCRP